MKRVLRTSFTFLLTLGMMIYGVNALAQESTVLATEAHTLEQMPEPPGGMNEWMFSHLAKNLRYPEMARDKGIEGTVVVRFIVEKDGTISETQILRGIGGGCDEEAIRVLQLSPKWKAGVKDGATVRTEMRLPIRFKLG